MVFKKIISRYPVLAYFVLVYLLTWGGILLIIQALASSSEVDATTRVAMVASPMLVSPGIAGITLTALLEGRAGLRTMLSRMTHWQVEFRWYVVALVTMPILVLAILFVLAFLVSPAFAPVLSLLGLAGLAAGFLEEIGWTGFAVPRLLSRWSPLAVGLFVGALWGLWHGLADYSIRGASLGTFWPIAFVLFVLPAMAWRVFMLWVYDHTQSGLVAQLMHFGYTGSLALFIPLAVISHTDDALIYAVLTGVLWILVVILAKSRQQAPERLPQTG